MSPDTAVARYMALIKMIKNLRAHQVLYKRYPTKDNYEKVRRLERALDNFLNIEANTVTSPQIELSYGK